MKLVPRIHRAAHGLVAFAAIALLLFGAGAHAQRAPADPWEADMRRFEAADRAQPPKPGGVVFVGSSSIRLWTTLAEDFPQRSVLNRGFGGSKIADATREVDRIVTPYRPRLVVLYAGDNDIADGADADRVLADFQAFVDAVHQRLPQVPIAYISVKPSPLRAQLLGTIRAANAMIRDYAGRQRAVRYIDVFTPMLDADGQPRADLFGPDRLHMNHAGYALWKTIVAPHLADPPPAQATRR